MILKLKSQSGVNSRLDPIEDLVEENSSELEEKYEDITQQFSTDQNIETMEKIKRYERVWFISDKGSRGENRIEENRRDNS